MRQAMVMSLTAIGKKLLNGHRRLKTPRTRSSMKTSSMVTFTRKLCMTAADQALPSTIFVSPQALTGSKRLKIRATNAGLLRLSSTISRLICAILSRIWFQLALSKGPSEPLHLDNWFQTLRDGIKEINCDGGTPVQRFNGNVGKVRVHVIHKTNPVMNNELVS